MNLKKSRVVGICGVSSSGKSTITKKLKNENIFDMVLNVDDYLLKPLLVYDEKLETYIELYDDLKVYDLDKFYTDLNSAKLEYQSILVEGFLLYARQDISDLIDIKIFLKVEKEICKERIRKRNDRNSDDYYFDEYVWKGFYKMK
jgi:uridine kinase